jgi:hypothetical protein
LLSSLAALLEREAGYQLISLVLIVTGVSLVDAAQRPQIAHDLVLFGTGVLARSMGAKIHTPANPATKADL